MVEAALDRLVEFHRDLPRQPTWCLDGAQELVRETEAKIPSEGTSFEKLLAHLFDRLIPMSLNCAHPGYMAYVPGGGLLHASVADLIADAVNRFVGIASVSPALARLEADTIRWFAGMLGFPPESAGFLSTGGSISNLSAVVSAREARLGEDFQRGTIYVSDQVHNSLRKAARLAGIPRANVRNLVSDDAFRLDPGRLRDRIRSDRDNGFSPFLVVGTAGTTNTGTVDDLDAISRIAHEEGLWFHVDAAYGGFFMLTERGRRAMRGIEKADSVTLDPHKSLFLPYGTGALVVRDRRALRAAHTTDGEYMAEMQSGSDLWDFAQYSPEQTRGFRGLRVWLPLKMHGAKAFEEALDEKLDLARWAAGELDAMEGIERLAEPELSVLAFRWRGRDLDGPALDEANRELLKRVNAKKRVYLSSTVLRGSFALRMCILSFRTHHEDVNRALEDLRSSISDASL